MANLNIRVDDTIKQNAFHAFETMGISPSDAIRAFLTYVAETGKMPIRQVVISDEDAELLAIAKQRLSETDKFYDTTLDELFK